MNVKSESIRGYRDNEVSYNLLSLKENAEGIVIMLPGMGYTVQAPLLHYSTGLFLHKGFEVLHVNYQYNSKKYRDFSIEELDEALISDSRSIIEKVLSEKSYSKIYFVAKSVGTIALSSELKRNYFNEAKAIWLTPLIKEDGVLQAMINSTQQGLCIIGSIDRHYDEERFSMLKLNPYLDLHLINGVNHSLEFDFNVVDSIGVQQEIIKVIEQFIEA
ncbi:hypothetical protein [Rossellomorea aquimaris]|uniref:hypothetical protein n=1 Tax=Rossellomorea aquimaris TaxID=189382 RepID=UPI0007D06445|nr:hypothetical protein [Rossellomorea aquimaris]